MKNLTWQNPEQLFVAQELINKVKSKCCGIKVNDNNLPELKIGSIPTMNSLIPLSQMASKPIYKMTGSDGVVGAHFRKVQESKAVFDGIVDRLLNIISYYDQMA